MEELISIIVPIYNAEKYICRCVDSILCQTYKNIEILLVNDGSQDCSLKICQEYAEFHDRIIVIDKPNEGVLKTRRVGLQHARGKWVSFVDSDDWLEPRMYEILINHLKEENAQVVMLANYTIRKASCVGKYIDSLTALKKLCCMEFPASMWAGMYSRELISGMVLSDDIHFFEDFMFNYRLLHMTDKVALCYDDLYHYEINDGSINRQPLNYKRMSCLKIIHMLVTGGELYDERLCEEIDYCIAHFLVSNIVVLSRRNKNTVLFSDLKEHCKAYGDRIRKAKIVPVIYKWTIFVTSISVMFMALIMDIRNTTLRRKIKDV